MADLGDISPARLDKYDRANYRQDGSYWVSRRNPRFILADLNKIDETTVMAMLALDKCLVIRKRIHGEKTISIYLMGPHTWALWGWCEAADREEIEWHSNNLIHIDDHPDISGEPNEFPLCILSMETVDRVISQGAQSRSIYNQDPAGISRFIFPAARSRLVSAIYWVYSCCATEEAKAANIANQRELQKLIAERDRFLEHGDPGEVWTTRDLIDFRFAPLIESAEQRSRLHNEFPLFTDPSFERCPAKFTGYRSDAFPFEAKELQRGGNIVDIDIDVDDSVEGTTDIVRPHLARENWASCITIAISPQFGARENHIQKVMATLARIL
jgi:hypothetical protein